MAEVLRFYYHDGIQDVHPSNYLVKNWLFKSDEQTEATLAHYVAEIGERNGITPTELHILFPAILRMLKSDIDWSVK